MSCLSEYEPDLKSLRLPLRVARSWKKNELATTPRFSSRSAICPELELREIVTATVPSPSPWSGWKRELANQRIANSTKPRTASARPRRRGTDDGRRGTVGL